MLIMQDDFAWKISPSGRGLVASPWKGFIRKFTTRLIFQKVFVEIVLKFGNFTEQS